LLAGFGALKSAPAGTIACPTSSRPGDAWSVQVDASGSLGEEVQTRPSSRHKTTPRLWVDHGKARAQTPASEGGPRRRQMPR